MIGFDHDLTIRREIDRVLQLHGAEVRVVMEFDNIETIKRAIEIDAGVACCPSRQCCAKWQAERWWPCRWTPTNWCARWASSIAAARSWAARPGGSSSCCKAKAASQPDRRRRDGPAARGQSAAARISTTSRGDVSGNAATTGRTARADVGQRVRRQWHSTPTRRRRVSPCPGGNGSGRAALRNGSSSRCRAAKRRVRIR